MSLNKDPGILIMIAMKLWVTLGGMVIFQIVFLTFCILIISIYR